MPRREKPTRLGLDTDLTASERSRRHAIGVLSVSIVNCHPGYGFRSALLPHSGRANVWIWSIPFAEVSLWCPGQRSRFPDNISMFVILLRIWESPLDHVFRTTPPATSARGPAIVTL